MEYTLAWQKFYQEVNRPDGQIDLAKAALYFAATEYPELEVNYYLQTLADMAEAISVRLPVDRYPLKVIKTINQYLFTELGFQGNQNDYYNPGNSFLNEVIDRGLGIPITLSVIYLEVAKRINFPMVGIGMPGHFLIRPDFKDAGIFVDAFHQGEILFTQDCEEILQRIYQQPIKLESYFLEPVTNQQILARMLTNLKFIYLDRQQIAKALAMVEGILMLFPHHPREIRDRGLLYYHLGERQQAITDLQMYLTLVPDAQDAERIKNLLTKLDAY